MEGQRRSGGEGFGSSTFSLLPWFCLLTWPLPRPSHPSATAPPRTSFPLLPWRRLRRLAPSARNSANSIDASSAQHLLLKPFALRNLGTCAPAFYWPTFSYSELVLELERSWLDRLDGHGQRFLKGRGQAVARREVAVDAEKSALAPGKLEPHVGAGSGVVTFVLRQGAEATSATFDKALVGAVIPAMRKLQP